MNSSKPIVLGIDPGSRQIGVAVFRGNELLFYGVKTIKRKTKNQTLAKLRSILICVFEEYNLDCVAVEEPIYIQQRNSFVNDIYKNIKKTAHTHRIDLVTYSPKFVRNVICGAPKPTKDRTAKRLTKIYPEIKQHFQLPRIWQRKYYALLFDAVAVGLVCVWEIQKCCELNPKRPFENS